MPRKTFHSPIVAAAFAALLAVSCAQPKPAEISDTRAADEAAIRAADADFAKAAAAKDLDKCMSLYADDAVFLSSGSPAAVGKDNIRTVIQRMLATPMQLTIHVASVDVARSGDLAVDRGTVEAAVSDKKGKTTTQTSEYMLVWKKGADGTWKIVADTSANEK
ncbi:MAG TPA: SgcJ/EcaC family oxidoreductase [Candidatus Acidoferrales bacterium]